mmetsp:Transcript_12603/g.37462  ORF Transcript_12603/g.37462 Transcript_12603/m.37462 type:complete len:253 (+) Transcript_12603:1430-2188(+)
MHHLLGLLLLLANLLLPNGHAMLLVTDFLQGLPLRAQVPFHSKRSPPSQAAERQQHCDQPEVGDVHVAGHAAPDRVRDDARARTDPSVNASDGQERARQCRDEHVRDDSPQVPRVLATRAGLRPDHRGIFTEDAGQPLLVAHGDGDRPARQRQDRGPLPVPISEPADVPPEPHRCNERQGHRGQHELLAHQNLPDCIANVSARRVLPDLDEAEGQRGDAGARAGDQRLPLEVGLQRSLEAGLVLLDRESQIE